MSLEQVLAQEQSLILTPAMRQALRCLETPAAELSEYLQEEALSNPLLEVDLPPISMPVPRQPEAGDASIRREERLIWEGESSAAPSSFPDYVSSPVSFREHLDLQLKLMSGLDKPTEALCHYLVGCLNSAGYLDCPLSELAGELGCSRFDLEQALFVVQSLDPPGTGARDLSECLLLQLAQGPEFNAVNIHLVKAGLPLLAERDYTGLSKLLRVSREEVLRAAEVIRSLNPIPSRGFAGDQSVPFIQPEATIRVEDGQAVVEMNTYGVPKLSLSRDYCALLENEHCAEAQPYLREKIAEAKKLISSVENRQNTLFRLISAVVQRQLPYFTSGQELRPLSMKDLAEDLSLNVSTVSRGVKDKYLLFDGRVLPLRSLFRTALETQQGVSVSPDFIHKQMRRFLDAENPASPLSDEALSEALSGIGINISRRTVAKYRQAMNIPSAAARKRAAAEKGR